ncbi:MAG: helix-turn-helix transcriptional regulator [Treponema sp.]|nr:helix-turn-helix transcriptional regulator [Treponema sp.]
MNIFNTNVIHLRNVTVMQGIQYKETFREKRNYNSISLRFSGHARFLLDNNQPMDSINGAITFMPESQSYIHQQIEASEIIAIHFNSDELYSCKPFVFYPSDKKNFQYLFNQLFEIWREDSEPSAVTIMAPVYKIIESIINASDIQLGSSSSKILLAAIKHIRRKFNDPELTIGECACSADISEIYLRQLFRKELKISPSQYLCNFRINYAKNLLASGYYTVMEIAARSGFSNSSYFCKIFRENTGLSPLKYAKLQ